ncbi:aminotransferase class V-fold PLP-dependent enzyme [Sorangium sp. So ce321]|uniref:aminotransferase class V-fold PLP-dependent enzyme n=1 Tax=Sorangium sp. So ce321 TaxID=3133300 RepID=UPI003F627EC2
MSPNAFPAPAAAPAPDLDAGAARALWPLDPAVTFLNHGSFGACPRAVLEAQQRYRDQMEREPVRFFIRELEPLLDAARGELAAFVGADPEDVAFVPNATAGVNTVLRSLSLGPGDELCVTDHGYNACRNAVEAAAARAGARVVVAPVPFPLQAPEQVVEAVLARVGPRTRLVLVDHVTSPTGLVFPVASLASELAGRGVDLLVDGAHAPGMVPLDLRALGAAYYTGNCHKWLCGPKGAAFLHVRRDRQGAIRPLTISHGANSPRTDRSRFLLEFDWTGTADPSAALCVADAIRFMGALLPGGWPALRAHNRTTALAARDLLCEALGCPPPSPDAMIGALATVPLPDAPSSPLRLDPLQDALLERWGIEVPVFAWPASPRRWLRISAQIYNGRPDYERLAAALSSLL